MSEHDSSVEIVSRHALCAKYLKMIDEDLKRAWQEFDALLSWLNSDEGYAWLSEQVDTDEAAGIEETVRTVINSSDQARKVDTLLTEKQQVTKVLERITGQLEAKVCQLEAELLQYKLKDRE